MPRRVATSDGSCCCGMGTGSCYFCCSSAEMIPGFSACLKFTYGGTSYAIEGTAVLGGGGCLYGFSGGPPFGPDAIGQWLYSGYLYCDVNGAGGPTGWRAGFELIRPGIGSSDSYSVLGSEATVLVGTCNPFCQAFSFPDKSGFTNISLVIGDCALPCEPDGTGTSECPCITIPGKLLCVTVRLGTGPEPTGGSSSPTADLLDDFIEVDYITDCIWGAVNNGWTVTVEMTPPGQSPSVMFDNGQGLTALYTTTSPLAMDFDCGQVNGLELSYVSSVGSASWPDTMQLTTAPCP